jgi:hypothetical protein
MQAIADRYNFIFIFSAFLHRTLGHHCAQGLGGHESTGQWHFISSKSGIPPAFTQAINLHGDINRSRMAVGQTPTC